MAKCGKGCMPECEYFTTGGCISPFNCSYKIETGYINSSTSVPTYMGQYNGMSDDDIKRLKTENADLHEKLKETEHRAEVAERALLLMARGECTFASPEFYKEEAEREVAKEEQIMANRCGEGKCEYFESTRRAANNNRENGYCKKYKQELHLYDWWWLKCDECTAEKKITEEQK